MAPRIAPAERERVVQELGEYFSRDQLSLEEYERRVEAVYRASERAALATLTADLPPLAGPSGVPSAAVTTASPAPRRRTVLALLSGVARRGAWQVPARVRAMAIMGGVDLDLRNAVLTEPVTDIHAVALCGGITVTVPPHARLEVNGLAILGGFEDRSHTPASASEGTPVVRVHGMAIMGAVEARVRPPRE